MFAASNQTAIGCRVANSAWQVNWYNFFIKNNSGEGKKREWCNIMWRCARARASWKMVNVQIIYSYQLQIRCIHYHPFTVCLPPGRPNWNSHCVHLNIFKILVQRGQLYSQQTSQYEPRTDLTSMTGWIWFLRLFKPALNVLKQRQVVEIYIGILKRNMNMIQLL